jgi:hypothetical protein
MTKIESGGRIYTVVEVIRGVAVDARSFLRLSDALRCTERLRKGRNLQEDDVQLFASSIGYRTRRK